MGTLWVISHEEAIHFDSGDARVMTELAAFAGLALKMIQDASVLRASEERLNLALHQQEMLTREMSHRVKNLFAIAIGMVSISAKSAATPQDMAKTLLGRLNALARAHDLVLRGLQADGQIIREATLTRLLEAIFQPYTDLARTGDPKRIIISGEPSGWACKLLREAKIAKPTGSKLVKGPAELEKFVRWKSMKNSEENS